MGILDSAELLRQTKNYSGSGDYLDESGNGHHAQFGSTGGEDTNDPQFLPWDGTQYLHLPGTTGNFASTPDSGPLSIVGDIDLRFLFALDDYTPPVLKYFAAKSLNIPREWFCQIAPDGRPSLTVSPDGSLQTGYQFDNPGETDASLVGWRFTLDVDNGSNSSVATFYRRDDTDIGSDNGWSQVGSSQSAALISIFDGNSPVEFGTIFNGTLRGPSGQYHRMIIKNGINGTTVFDADLTDVSALSEPFDTFTEASSEAATVTINRSSSGLYVVDQPLMGRYDDDYFETPDHANLDFAANEDFTAFVMIRAADATPAADEALLAKKADLSTAAGYAIYLDTTGVPTGIIADGSASIEAVGGALSDRILHVIAFKRDTGADTITVYTDGVAGTPVTDTTTASLVNAGVLRTGRLSGAGTNYADGSEFADVLFRSALSDAEVVEVGDALVSAAITVTPDGASVTVTPAAVVVTTITDLTPAAVTVTVSEGTLTITTGSVPITPTGLTVTATPSGLTITTGSVPITPAGLTVTVSAGTTRVAQGVIPDPLTVTATAGSVAVTTSTPIIPAALTVTVTAGTVDVSVGQPVTPASLTVTVTASGLAITTGSVPITPDPLTVTVTPGTTVITTGSVPITPSAATVTVTAGTVTFTTGSVPIIPGDTTVNASAGTMTVTTGSVPIVPASLTVNATPATLTVTTGTPIVPAAVTVTVAAGTVTITTGSVPIIPDTATVNATAGTVTITAPPITSRGFAAITDSGAQAAATVTVSGASIKLSGVQGS